LGAATPAGTESAETAPMNGGGDNLVAVASRPAVSVGPVTRFTLQVQSMTSTRGNALPTSPAGEVIEGSPVSRRAIEITRKAEGEGGSDGSAIARSTEEGEYPSMDQTPPTPRSFEFGMGAAAPNPFNPRTLIPFTLEESAPSSLMIYDAAGRRVVVLVEGTMERGAHVVEWDGRTGAGLPVASGVYSAVLRTKGKEALTRLVLLK
ncbi:MAG: hypothetical protein CME06_10765, partial [Gemmatimonadetes bacterium]|nr:hypothetical protein [Gemmatimonadota bacterium]